MPPVPIDDADQYFIHRRKGHVVALGLPAPFSAIGPELVLQVLRVLIFEEIEVLADGFVECSRPAPLNPAIRRRLTDRLHLFLVVHQYAGVQVDLDLRAFKFVHGRKI